MLVAALGGLVDSEELACLLTLHNQPTVPTVVWRRCNARLPRRLVSELYPSSAVEVPRPKRSASVTKKNVLAHNLQLLSQLRSKDRFG